MLKKKVVIDSINVIESGHIEVRQATKIFEDGKELSKSYHRWVISPGDDVSNETDRVKKIAAVVHTKKVIDAHKARLAKQENERNNL